GVSSAVLGGGAAGVLDGAIAVLPQRADITVGCDRDKRVPADQGGPQVAVGVESEAVGRSMQPRGSVDLPPGEGGIGADLEAGDVVGAGLGDVEPRAVGVEAQFVGAAELG